MSLWVIIVIVLVSGSSSFAISAYVNRDRPGRKAKRRCGDVMSPDAFRIAEEVKSMGIQKFGQGEILPEDKDQQKTAKENWTEEDRKDLKEENEK